MAEANTLRNRSKQNKDIDSRHETAKAAAEKTDQEFTHRESLLTVLIAKSLHIRAIYHIFVVILLMLLFDTVIYDLVEKGK